MARALTERQRSVYNFIEGFIREQGYPPTVRDICEHFNIKSTNGVVVHLSALEKKGYLLRQEGKSRSIRLLQSEGLDDSVTALGDASDTREIPILGKIAAGAPIHAYEDREAIIKIDSDLFAAKGEKLFALRIRGNSMIGDGIMPDDIVFVRPQSEAREGELVAVMVNGDATVKRYEKRGNIIRLIPSNPDVEVLEVDMSKSNDFQILGVIRGVLRDYR